MAAAWHSQWWSSGSDVFLERTYPFHSRHSWSCFGPFGCGSKLNHQGLRSFCPCFHLPGLHFGTGFLSHSHLRPSLAMEPPWQRRSPCAGARQHLEAGERFGGPKGPECGASLAAFRCNACGFASISNLLVEHVCFPCADVCFQSAGVSDSF